ncbi:MAG: recombination protein RecR [Oscillospiraceae bacterium]|nr:recombination protein RecR [Oscillospiraceae bacterium]
MADIVSLQKLIEEFRKMPSVGLKSAERFAYYVLGLDDKAVKSLTDAITDAHDKIHTCSVCCNFTEDEKCNICNNPKRDSSTICVVENPRDITAFERTHEYRGVYHVLHGVMSPMNGIGPNDIRIKELISRLADDTVNEVIMATNPTAEGEATAVYISKLLKPMGIKVTRLAYGMPVGSDLEYADEVTLSRALDGRQLL